LWRFCPFLVSGVLDEPGEPLEAGYLRGHFLVIVGVGGRSCQWLGDKPLHGRSGGDLRHQITTGAMPFGPHEPARASSGRGRE